MRRLAAALEEIVSQKDVTAPCFLEGLSGGLGSDKSAAARMADQHLTIREDLHSAIGHRLADAQLAASLGRGQEGFTRAETARADVFFQAFGQPMGLRRTAVSILHVLDYNKRKTIVKVRLYLFHIVSFLENRSLD